MADCGIKRDALVGLTIGTVGAVAIDELLLEKIAPNLTDELFESLAFSAVGGLVGLFVGMFIHTAFPKLCNNKYA